MIFACWMIYPDDLTELHKVRPTHRDYMFGLHAQGKVISAGSFVPQDDGGLFLYVADNIAEAQGFVEADPYVAEGVVKVYRLREYEVHAANPALLEASKPKSQPKIAAELSQELLDEALDETFPASDPIAVSRHD